MYKSLLALAGRIFVLCFKRYYHRQNLAKLDTIDYRLPIAAIGAPDYHDVLVVTLQEMCYASGVATSLR